MLNPSASGFTSGETLNSYVGVGQSNGSSNGPAAVTASNPHKGVKRGILGNPVGVPQQLPGFRGRVIDAGAAIKAPKLRNGNLNNKTSNVRVPYSRVAPLEFLSSYTGRLSPGDVVFVHKFAPGFVQKRPLAVNATLGVNTTTRVVGLDGLNRLLMGSNPAGWQVDLNVMYLNDPNQVARKPTDVSKGGNTAEFALSVLDEYRLDGIVISNDEPGAFTSSGARDNVQLNVAIQGPTECNNGFLEYEDSTSGSSNQYNPLTGVTNQRTVESYARGSSQSGTQHIPGRVGSPWLSSGKVDFVANFCGTYSMYPSQMFDRGVETMNGLYLGLRAFEMTLATKRKVTKASGGLLFANDADADAACMVFFQYMPFSSRVAAVIGLVTHQHEEDLRDEAAKIGTVLTEAEVEGKMEEDRKGDGSGRAKAAKMVPSTKRRSSISDFSKPFDDCTYDPVRTNDLWHMVGAWHVGRVLDTKAARHDAYAGGPRDTAFTCIVDVGLSWRSAVKAEAAATPPPEPDIKQRDPYGATANDKLNQQTSVQLSNHAQPALGGTDGVLGKDFGSMVTNGLLGCEDSAVRTRKDARRVAELKTAFALDVKQAKERRAQQLEAAKEAIARRAQELAAATLLKEEQLKKQSMPISEEETLANKQALAELASTYGVPDDDPPMKAIRDTLLLLVRKVNADKKISDEDLELVRATKTAFDLMLKANDEDSFKVAREKLIATSVEEMRELSLFDELKSDDVQKVIDLTEEKKNTMTVDFKRIKVDYNKIAEQDPKRNLLAVIWNRIYARALMYKEVFKTLQGRLNEVKRREGLTPEERKAEDRARLLQPGRDAAIKRSENTTNAPWEEELLEHIHGMELISIHASGYEHVGCCLRPIKETSAPKAPSAKPRGRSKTPPKGRTAPASSTPLVPTAPAAWPLPVTTPTAATPAAATPAAPRRRAREGGEASTTNSVFESMFAASPTAAAVEEPASPTQSSGSDVPGPRTFRRIPR